VKGIEVFDIKGTAHFKEEMITKMQKYGRVI
jgi:hypothetical protein